MTDQQPATSRTGPATFVLTSQRDGDRHTLAPRAELDLATTPEVDAELQRIEASDARAIVLDLSALAFIDSAGIRLTVRADERARANGNRLALIASDSGRKQPSTELSGKPQRGRIERVSVSQA